MHTSPCLAQLMTSSDKMHAPAELLLSITFGHYGDEYETRYGGTERNERLMQKRIKADPLSSQAPLPKALLRVDFWFLPPPLSFRLSGGVAAWREDGVGGRLPLCIVGVVVVLGFASMAFACMASQVLRLLSSCKLEVAILGLLAVLLWWEPEAAVGDGQRSCINKLVVVLLVRGPHYRRGGESGEGEAVWC